MTPTPVSDIRTFDVCVVGGTPAGVAAAVRAARAGLRVLLTQHTRHLGGMCTNGLGQWDAKSDHRRCPIFAEILDRVETHYRETAGAGSTDHLGAQYRVDHYPMGRYEPSVIEGIFTDLVAAEPGITVWLGVYPEAAETVDGRVAAVTCRDLAGDVCRVVRAAAFVDATYEGDLVALTGASWRAGREGRDEYDEPHAGLLFTRICTDREVPELALTGHLNVHSRWQRQGAIDPASPFTADNRIQAYNIRGCVCQDPARRLLLEEPPAGYDRADYLHYRRRSLCIGADINGKNSWNSAILPGENWDYPDGDWATRQAIYARHRDFALGLMWFLQNDPSMDAEARERFRVWGLPADEFTDNGHVPWEMYVREARRIVGRYVLAERDLLPRPGFLRPQPFADSVCFNDWYMDSHSCSRDLGTFGVGDDLHGSDEYPYEGKLILMEEFRPGMIPYRSLVCDEVANLIVPVCASVTHVVFGAMRLEPVWIHLGEVAGYAVAQAVREGTALNRLDVSRLQRTMLADGVAIAFFNEHRAAAADPAYADRQLAACHGDWDSYSLASAEGPAI